MWSANIIVGAAGFYFLWRAAHDQTVVNFSRLWPKVRRLLPGSRKLRSHSV
jgi:hypothetical protein